MPYSWAMTLAYRVVALFALTSIGAAAGLTVPEQLEKWHQGRRLAVVMKTGDTIIGRLGPVKKESFLLVSEERGHADRLVRIGEIQSVKTKMATSTKIAIGIVIASPFVVGTLILGK